MGWGGTRFSATISVLCVVGLVLVGRAALAAHMLIVPHQVSGTGLLVHPDHGSDSPDAVHRVGHHSSATPGLVSGDDGHDDYCEVAGLVETHQVVTSPLVASDLLVWILPRLSPPPAVAGAGLPLLLLAPKQSPPRV